MNEASKKFVSRVERLNLALSAALIIASLLLQDKAVIIGVVSGTALGALNFRLISFVTRRIIEGNRGKVFYFALFGVKFLLLITIIYFMIVYLPLDVSWLVISLSLIFLSLFLVSLFTGVRRQAA